MAIAHSHNNRDLLETITQQDIANWNAAMNPSNSLKELTDTSLVSLKDGQILQYDSKSGKWKNGNKPAYDVSDLGGISSTDPRIENWTSAYNNSHTHSNKSTIDSISSSSVSEWNTAYSWGNHSNAGYLTGAALSTHENATSVHGATSSNTGLRIVMRDDNGNFSAGTITASLSGNASSATKLATARTLWGQSFDGTGNVSGAITGATTGSFSSDVTISGHLTVKGETTTYSLDGI